MTGVKILTRDLLRDRFATAMDAMYRGEVPAYASLVDMVAKQNIDARSKISETRLVPDVEDARSYHGAIRLGTAKELRIIRRAFEIMGMYPVGYYDLSAAGLPVHSTAFRPTASEAINVSPFRVFTSLLRLDMIEGEDLRRRTDEVLSTRDIFSPRVMKLIDVAKQQGGLSVTQADEFVLELLETFRWKTKANVSRADYELFGQSYRLLADIVSFQGPHINHLTVRAEDIDAAHVAISSCGVDAKSSIEGPPKRKCPILLRQTAFKAIAETVLFPDGRGGLERGSHTARFGEIEARGAALTPRGRTLYDKLLTQAQTRQAVGAEPLQQAFGAFPDDWTVLREMGLIYFRYRLTPLAMELSNTRHEASGIDKLIAEGLVEAVPITYEDFLPVSAAGIFRSNLGEEEAVYAAGDSRKLEFEACLGTPVIDPFELYQAIETSSLSRCMQRLSTEISEPA